MDWNDYHDIDTINAWLDEKAANNNDFVSVINIGKSYEGRDMKVLAITKAGPGKPNIWLEAGIHAREWIAPAVATYIVNQLVSLPRFYLGMSYCPIFVVSSRTTTDIPST